MNKYYLFKTDPSILYSNVFPERWVVGRSGGCVSSDERRVIGSDESLVIGSDKSLVVRSDESLVVRSDESLVVRSDERGAVGSDGVCLGETSRYIPRTHWRKP